MFLTSLVVKHERRIRVLFSDTCAAGAFVTSLYRVVNLDSNNTSPNVVAVFIISGIPNVVELQLDADLAAGSMYSVFAEGVPSTDASVTAMGSFESFRFGTARNQKTIEPGLRDLDRLRFGADLVWTGSDYQEDPNGDLARIEGRPNVTKAVWHSVQTNGLPWDGTWGVDAREYVDSPSTEAAPLRGAVAVQAARDPRVKSVTTTVSTRGDQTFIDILPVLISGEPLEPVAVVIPSS